MLISSMLLRTRYAIPGTNISCAATQWLRDVRFTDTDYQVREPALGAHHAVTPGPYP